MQLRIISDAVGLLSLGADWQRLWALQPRPEAFTHHAWARLFVQCYSHGGDLHCAVATDGGVVRGILPLMRDPKGILRFIGDPRADYSDMLCAPADAVEVAQCLLQGVEQSGKLQLESLPEHSLLLSALRGSLRSRLKTAPLEPCPAIVFDSAGEVLRALLKKESLRRHEKKVAKLGPVSLTKLALQSEALAALPLYVEMHRRRWAGTSTPSLFDRPEHVEFHRLLIADEEMWPMVDFRLLYAGDVLVAAHFGFMLRGRFIWYRPAYDPAHAALGPGEVLMKFLIAASVADGCGEFDFTRGNEGFKQRFATVIRRNSMAHCPTVMQRVRAVAAQGRVWLNSRRAKQSG
jgi:CelD/BcsL family acetyltransferase involved in cellulose biosynthesis